MASALAGAGIVRSCSDLASSTRSPSPGHIALALIVLKSKPAEVSLEDYFSQLRRHVQDGPRSKSAAEYQHLDSTAFWKHAYETSEAAQAKLLDRIYELEQNRPSPEDRSTVLKAPASPAATNRRKRKNDMAAKANYQSKRRALWAKTAQLPQTVTEEFFRTEIADEPDEPQSCLEAFMRLFFNLRQQIVSKRPDNGALQQSLQKFCRVAAAIFLDTSLANSPPEPSQKSSTQTQSPTASSNLESTALVIRRSYASILQGLDELCSRSDRTSEVGGVVYEVIVLFETILAKMSTLANEVAKEAEESNSKAKTGKAKSRAPKQAHTPSQGHHATCQSLAQLMAIMLTTLDPSKESQSQILEGCLCAFLDHLGSSLSLAVFVDDQLSEQREMFTGILPPQGLQDISTFDSETATRAVQLEAPYLIYILENVMTFVDGHQALMSSRSASLFSLSKNSWTSSNVFAKQIKEKLQNTLLKGVFGSGEKTFRNSLQRPAGPDTSVDEDLPARPDPAVQTPDWFTGEVWRILGWNILASDDESF